jgi:hypothetical protein
MEVTLGPEKDLIRYGRKEAFVSKAINIYEIVNIPLFYPCFFESFFIGVCLDCLELPIEEKSVFCHDNLPRAAFLISVILINLYESYKTGLTSVCQWLKIFI